MRKGEDIRTSMADEIRAMRRRGEDRTDWAKADAMTDADLERAIGRIHDVATGPDGFLYLLTNERDGALYRLEPAAGRDPA